MRKVLYLGWIGFNNLGDEWMWEMFKTMANAHLKEDEYSVIPSLPNVEWKKVSEYDTIVLGGGSLIVPGYVDLVHEAMELGKTIIIWGSGHDRLHKWDPSSPDGLKPEAAVETERYRQKLKAIMEHSVYCGVRGPWTKDYIESLGALPKHLVISGDSAMLMNALEPASAAQSALNDMQAREKTIGINWGTSYNRIYGGNEERLENALAEAGRTLLALGYKLHLYAVWGPDGEALARLYRKLGQDDRVTVDPEVYTAVEYVKLLAGFEATINFKLHANLLSAVANVPFVCIGYRFKSFDYMYGLDLADWIIASDDLLMAEKLVEKVGAAAAGREGYISKLDEGRRTAYQSLVTPFRERLF
ncbi:polysaccharide pyruvyl transferase WcaK-like protein [Paenibacillus taihuensis]|uniref:Polysaccharide pyruvyl transferase WcaK-like protein n=1 Tax=Paenibacillus taihuensis TaxID=1156355 RepID=A0A3D9SFZ8_9BACL|nr:polysaccharide pyruvyl transferase family protein [Paenibacillus taihuensis]REE89083.1 polysaccharide pyruvyl transferase WcaK-like protein [Paenibacillus taihuensis]